jgi:tripartite-type tricarboxylate transporter receptor subunit TctC
MTIQRRSVIKAGLGVAAPFMLAGARAQSPEANWPAAPVKIIVPFTAGGASDVLTRRLAERLQARLGQSWTVENRTGAGGNIGMEAVKNAAPDGYTICSATIGTLSINQFLFAKMPYDPVADYAYVSTIWENCNVFVVPVSNPARTVQEFLEWARRKPQGVSFGSAGVGTTPHLAGEMFRHRMGLTAVHIPFRGAAQSMPALMAGETDFAIDNIASYMPLIKTGKVKVLAITANSRWPTLPDIPTMAEAGIKDFIITSWGAFVMPRGTPVGIVNKVSTTIAQIAQDPQVKEQFLTAGALSVYSSPRETEAFAERERAKWKEVIRIANVQMQ